jgi:pimeloyl-ACP methyl ester carboxylesterase
MREIMAMYDGALAAWPVPHEDITISTRYGDTFIIASGDKAAPPLILLHGASSNAVSWIGEAADYSRYFRVYAVDIIGEPGRSASARPDWDGNAYAEWLEDVLGGLGARQASILGISQGGWIALKFATVHPEHVTKLVLLATAGVTPARLSFLLRAIPLTLLGRRGAEASNRIVFGRQPIHPAAVAFMNAIMTNFKPRIGNLPLFSDADLRKLTMPVLLVAGEQDALYASRKMAERLKALLPDLQVFFDPDMGHVLYGVTENVLPFLCP